MLIKNVEIANPYILAPMAGVTDFIFRDLCADAGAGLVVTEMVSVKGLLHNSQNTRELLHTSSAMHKTAVQLFTDDPELIVQAIKLPELQKFDIIDINMGCPVPKIVNNGMGSALLKDLPKASKIIQAAALATTKPVTVKFRIGYDADSLNGVEFAQMCKDSGAAAITVHGRTKTQGYSGVANFDEIAKIARTVDIPVFGNGDITSKTIALEKMQKYDLDGVAIGRGALGNPWIFADLTDNKNFDCSIKNILLKHLSKSVEFYGAHRGVPLMRKHLNCYLKRANVCAKDRNELMKISDFGELVKSIENLF